MLAFSFGKDGQNVDVLVDETNEVEGEAWSFKVPSCSAQNSLPGLGRGFSSPEQLGQIARNLSVQV